MPAADTRALSAPTGRPRLYHVAPLGLTIAERVQARKEAAGRRRTWAFPGYDDDSPERAGFNAGIAYGTWAVDPEMTDNLASLAYHLTRHTMRVIHSHRYIVTVNLLQQCATISVLALSGRTVEVPDLGTHPEISRLAETWGAANLAAGPCVYAAVTVPA